MTRTATLTPPAGRTAAIGDRNGAAATDRPTACPVRLINRTCPDDCHCPFLALRSLLRLLQGA